MHRAVRLRVPVYSACRPVCYRSRSAAAHGTMPEKSNIVWFRKGLRLHDNHALDKALKDAKTVYPIFCLDPWFIDNNTIGANRINFLLESLTDLDNSLKEKGSRLIVLHGKPLELIPAVAKAWKADGLYFEKDTEPYAIERDGKMMAEMKKHKIEVEAPVGHTLWNTEALIAKNNGHAPKNMTGIEQLAKRMGKVAQPIDAPDELPAVPDKAVTDVKKHLCGSKGNVPSLKDLGYDPQDATTPFKGGETEALKRLDKFMALQDWVCEFEKPKGNPASFEPPATTVLSPYMKFGCLSCRLFWHRIQEVYAAGDGHTKPPTSLEGQLLWREFFYTAGFDTKNFDKMEGNSQVRQIPWDDNPEFVERWRNAQTGYPWIDAIMTQLRQWGWMHHLARHSVACFLTRGDLWCHWEKGRDVFDEWLIDGDHFVNNGNWQWLSCSNFFYQYFRVYSPVSFGQKYDKEGAFVRHFLPVLKDMPAKYIYEPWKAPKDVQEKANCIIGKDYPEPIVDHGEASKENKQKMKDAYAAHKSNSSGTQSTPSKRKAND